MGAMPSTFEHAIAGAGILGGASASVDRPMFPALAGAMIDLPDVLYDDTSWRRWLLRLVQGLGVREAYADFFQTWDRQYATDVNCGRREGAEAFQSFLLAAGLTWAQVDEVEAATHAQRDDFERSARVLPGVVKTLDALSDRGLVLVAWADAPCPAGGLVERLARLSVAGCFHAVLSSFDVECSQPDSRCYEIAADAVGASPAELMYVGHDPEHLASAKAAGLRTVAFNFAGAVTADAQLGRFEDLLAIAKNWSAPGSPESCGPAPRLDSSRHPPGRTCP